MTDYQSDNYAQIHRYLEILSVCHTVITEKSKNSNNPDHLAYNASSPDELALVNAAKYFGYNFKGRDDDNNMVVELRGVDDELGMGSNTKQFQLLTVIEFTSTRKRMTVIVRSQQDSTIRVMCKGADSIVLPLLKGGQNALIQKTQDFLDDFSKEGLRTLVLAEEVITDEEYHSWNKEYQSALVATQGREEKVNQVAEKLEQQFELVGSTAIEDKLQDRVEDTLEFIKAAGVRIWVLTGDKIETAINIGISCRLLNVEMETFIIDGKSSKRVMDQITSARRDQKMTELVRENAVIVAGDSLIKITKNLRVKQEFLELAQAAKVVIACRVSPKQKAEIVTMVRLNNPGVTTLAIGDGANDVNMITAAHVGVGISGLEG